MTKSLMPLSVASESFESIPSAKLFDIAELLGKQPRPPGPRLAIVTNGGGPVCSPPMP